MLRNVDRQSGDFHYKMAFELLCAFFSIPELKISEDFSVKVKSCYNPLRLETVIVLVSSGIDFVNTPHLYSDRATR